MVLCVAKQLCDHGDSLQVMAYIQFVGSRNATVELNRTVRHLLCALVRLSENPISFLMGSNKMERIWRSMKLSV